MSVTPDRLTAAAALAFMLAGCGAASASPTSSSVPTTTATVVRTDIVTRQRLNGTLTYAGAYTLTNEVAGIFTSLPAPGAAISRGQVLYRVGPRPIVLMYGDPEWRGLGVGVTDGSDVKQLEQNLLALGFGNSANLVASGHFDAFDAAAVRRWQASLDIPQTGAVGLGDVIFEPGAIRVAAVQPSPGSFAQPGQPVIQATSPTREVLVQLDVSLQQLVKVQDPVTVQLPDASTLDGHVSAVSPVAESAPSSAQGGGPTATIAVTIALTDPAAGGTFDEAPVAVDITVAVHAAVLAVPVMALLARPGGTYAVVVVEGSQRRLVTVATGFFDDRGLVEVSGPDLREGMSVEVPAP
jgi:peptidoglycan hydrolase-like protein with peptidoglycan-binding domain